MIADMRRLVTVLVSSVVLLTGLAPAAGAVDAPYSVARSKLRDALDCKGGERKLDGSGRKQPVLLVHGTGVTRRQNWGWNYWQALPEAGFEVCWVQLPKAATGDIQVSSEYVAWAYGFMHRKTKEKIDVLGHSQGGLEPRWGIKYFSTRRFVADYIALATPNHGTRQANHLTSLGGCIPACWQMRRGANFIAALNEGGETPGRIHYTSIYTATDELVQPPGTQALRGASNIDIQELCPGRPVDHGTIVGDGAVYELVLDALTNPGPARAARPENLCAQDAIGDAPEGFGTLNDWMEGKITDHEPRLKPYAR
jgi:triacylglycerol esterase/lipase EstA (alpha/beta hydrolase family)